MHLLRRDLYENEIMDMNLFIVKTNYGLWGK